MRKIMKKRHFHLSQIAVMLLLFISVIMHPKAGMSSTESSPKTHSTLSDGTVITTVSETALTENVVMTENKTAVVYTEQTETGESPKETPQEKSPAPFDKSIYTALKHQGLTEQHIGVWQEEHPLSTLNKLGTLAPAKQKKVANVAAFIRKVNPKISAKTAWREACALVFYSVKYNVSSDLVVSIAKAESRFNPSTQSKAGALGVMQVMWKVHNGMLRAKGIAPTRDHMFDPERGVEAGVLILSRYMSAYGTVQKALNRYYGGIAHNYLKKVNNNMAMLQRHSDKTGY
ncbi:transglycosylase SLT domain-containing protein [Cloacibacillus porcorum]|uniref:lytic transglycosylase domain-containing protein n=1 Tax=Cloacibacillus porcorum TaxID=1197717 RepID=UPI00258C588A|nr:transglycosylase SLT domain-containing protein [Cloacibacillus porcorum]